MSIQIDQQREKSSRIAYSHDRGVPVSASARTEFNDAQDGTGALQARADARQPELTQIQLCNSISRTNVSIDVPTDATVIGSIAAKLAPATATKAHNSQRGLLPRRST